MNFQGEDYDDVENIEQAGESDYNEQIGSDEEDLKIQSARSPTSSCSKYSEAIDKKKKSKNRIIFNIAGAKYDVIKYVGRKVLKWKLTKKEHCDWDICWTDSTVSAETLAKMLPYQKINHFPGILSIARKDFLGKNLMRMKKSFPDNYNFFPRTFLLPSDYEEFRRQFVNNKKPRTYIIKPKASCQGRGIFLTQSWQNVSPKEHYVAQEYIPNPHLIDGLKYDLRLYVLIGGCDPLRIWLFKDGLGRFATDKYIVPTSKNMENTYMHLTNYAINKDSPKFVFNSSSTEDDVGHKKSLKAVLKILQEEGHDVSKLWAEIKKIIVKTFCSVQPTFNHYYKSCHPNDPYNNMCFEVLGFDIMLDSNIKPWLIEVNHLPSFTTDTPLDDNIKKNVIKDALKIMSLPTKVKAEYKERKRYEQEFKYLSPRMEKLSKADRQVQFERAQRERDIWEEKNHGDFEKIYPVDYNDIDLNAEYVTENVEDYEKYIKDATKRWQPWLTKDVKPKPARSPPKRKNQETEPEESDDEFSTSRKVTSQSPRDKLPVNSRNKENVTIKKKVTGNKAKDSTLKQLNKMLMDYSTAAISTLETSLCASNKGADDANNVYKKYNRGYPPFENSDQNRVKENMASIQRFKESQDKIKSIYNNYVKPKHAKKRSVTHLKRGSSIGGKDEISEVESPSISKIDGKSLVRENSLSVASKSEKAKSPVKVFKKKEDKKTISYANDLNRAAKIYEGNNKSFDKSKTRLHSKKPSNLESSYFSTKPNSVVPPSYSAKKNSATSENILSRSNSVKQAPSERPKAGVINTASKPKVPLPSPDRLMNAGNEKNRPFIIDFKKRLIDEKMKRIDDAKYKTDTFSMLKKEKEEENVVPSPKRIRLKLFRNAVIAKLSEQEPSIEKTKQNTPRIPNYFSSSTSSISDLHSSYYDQSKLRESIAANINSKWPKYVNESSLSRSGNLIEARDSILREIDKTLSRQLAYADDPSDESRFRHSQTPKARAMI